MSNLHFSPSARRDLLELFDYIVEDNPAAAKRLLAELKQTFRRIARFPEIGVLREDLAPDLRGFPVRSQWERELAPLLSVYSFAFL